MKKYSTNYSTKDLKKKDYKIKHSNQFKPNLNETQISPKPSNKKLPKKNNKTSKDVSINCVKKVIMESNLMKAKTNTSEKYDIRWCQLTNTHFLCFDKRWSANYWSNNPIIAVPLVNIINAKKICTKGKKVHKFELIIKESNKPFKYEDDFSIESSILETDKNKINKPLIENPKFIKNTLFKIIEERKEEKKNLNYNDTENESMTSVIDISTIKSGGKSQESIIMGEELNEKQLNEDRKSVV